MVQVHVAPIRSAPFLAWTWDSHDRELGVDGWASLDAAVRDLMDSDEGILTWRIEEVGVGYVPDDEVRAVRERISQETPEPLPAAIHSVQVRELDGERWAQVRAVRQGQPLDITEEVARFGHDRVRVRPFGERS